MKREPLLSPNFVLYENDPGKLAKRIRIAARDADPALVRADMEKHQPALLHGDRSSLEHFLDRVSSGAIHSQLHREHVTVGR